MAYFDQSVDVLLSETQIRSRIAELGKEIARDYAGKDLTLLCVLRGAVFFATDLARAIDLPLTMEFLGASSYHGGQETTGEVRITYDAHSPLSGKHVLIVEDIVDTGLTMDYLLKHFRAKGVASIKLCALLEKPARAKVKIPIDYKGFVIDDHFVVGFGLDYAEKYRNVPFIGIMKPEKIG